MAVSFIGGGNWSTRRKPPTCRKSQQTKTDKLYHLMLYGVLRAMNGVQTHNFSGDGH